MWDCLLCQAAAKQWERLVLQDTLETLELYVVGSARNEDLFYGVLKLKYLPVLWYLAELSVLLCRHDLDSCKAAVTGTVVALTVKRVAVQRVFAPPLQFIQNPTLYTQHAKLLRITKWWITWWFCTAQSGYRMKHAGHPCQSHRLERPWDAFQHQGILSLACNDNAIPIHSDWSLEKCSKLEVE